jgi:hypothetical protein
MPFVKFSCGCIGLNTPAPSNSKDDGDAVVIKPCDLPIDMCWEPITIYRRDLSDKSTSPLSPEETEDLLNEIGGLVADGYRFRQVKSLLR